MFGPGAYRSDPTEGITAIADLPQPEIVPYSGNDKRQPCPRCGHSAYRDKQLQRTLHDLGNLALWCPRDLVVTYSQHYCTKRNVRSTSRLTCRIWRPRAVSTPTTWSIWRCGSWSRTACPPVPPAGTCGETTGCLSPLRRSRTGSRLGGKKAQARMDTDFLDWALADFSGYVAADELYDGPFCILSAVDNHCYKRILYEVLDHDPTHDDIRAFLRRLKTSLQARNLTLLGVTIDGSLLYPEPLAEVFDHVPHQVCEFHVVKA